MKNFRAALADYLGIIGFLISLGAAIGAWWAYVKRLMVGSNSSLPTLSGSSRALLVLAMGLVAAIAHGIGWSLMERIFRWNHHEHPRGRLVQGWSAIAISLTMTVPLVLVPALTGYLFHIEVIQPRHVAASCMVVLIAALGHLVLYGVPSHGLRGLRQIIFPLGTKSLPRALLMECVYAAVHFSSIVWVYRLTIRLSPSGANESLAIPTLFSACLWLLGVTTFYLLKYPASLSSPGTIDQRRFLNALMLMLTLEGGMLM